MIWYTHRSQTRKSNHSYFNVVLNKINWMFTWWEKKFKKKTMKKNHNIKRINKSHNGKMKQNSCFYLPCSMQCICASMHTMHSTDFLSEKIAFLILFQITDFSRYEPLILFIMKSFPLDSSIKPIILTTCSNENQCILNVSAYFKNWFQRRKEKKNGKPMLWIIYDDPNI